MKGILFFLMAVLLLVACGSSSRVPAGIIPSRQMETVMWQIMQADQYVTNVLLKDSSKKADVERSRIYQQVFELNHTTREAFQKSYQFYITHPEITKVVFDSIIAKAGRQRTDFYQHKPDTAVKRPGTPDTSLQHHGLPPAVALNHPLRSVADSVAKARKKTRTLKTGKHPLRK